MKTFVLLVSLSISFFCFSPTHAQVSNDLAFKLQNKLDVLRTALFTKGLGAAIRTPDGTIWAGGAGVSSLTPVDSINAEHRFPMGSISKTLLSASMLQLQEAGQLDLEDSLHQYLPTYPNVDPNITLRQLLQHVSGVHNYSNGSFIPTIIANPTQTWTVPELVNTFVSTPNFVPGAQYSYSNTGYILLSEVVNQVTGQPFYEVIRDSIIAPLDLFSFFHPYYEPWEEPFAHLWTDIFTGNQVVDEHATVKNWNALWTSAGAAGAWVGTPSDIAEWIYQLHTSDLLSSASLSDMRDWTSQSNFGYGLGAQKSTFQGEEGWGHTGGIFYVSYAFYFPGPDISLVVQTNDENNGGDVATVFNALLSLYLNYDPTSSTTAQNDLPTIEVFPNPATDYVIIQGPDNAVFQSATLHNQLGQRMDAAGLTGNRMSLAGLEPGLYLLRVVIENREITKKILVR